MQITKVGFVVLMADLVVCPPIAHSLPPQASQTNSSSVSASPPSPAPLTLDETLRLIKENKKDPKPAVSAITERGVGFELDEKSEKKLRKAGADDDLIAAIWQATPGGKARMVGLLTSPSGVELRASAAEAIALSDIQSEHSADSQLRMVDGFEKKFPSSPLLSYVETEGARAHQEKGDYTEAVEDARKSLKLDPDNTYSLIILALVLPQPKLGGSAKDAAGRLSEAVTDANRALELLGKLRPRPDETDDQFQARKGSLAADAHFAVGMAYMQMDSFEKAAGEYQAAIASTKQPNFQYYYRLAEAEASLGQVPAAIASLHKASDLARGTPMQKYADDFLAELEHKSH
jgi:tetratricopeptide (TPR) repeat protein